MAKERRRFNRKLKNKEGIFKTYHAHTKNFVSGFDWIMFLLIVPPVLSVIMSFYIATKF